MLQLNIDTPNPTTIEIPDQDSWSKALWQGFQQTFGTDPLGNWFFGGIIRFIVWCVQAVVDTFEYVMGHFIGILTALQGKAGPNFYPFVGAIIEDVLGGRIQGSAIAEIAASKGDVAANRAIGASLLQQLQSELVGDGSISESQGAQALQTFLGFLMEYAIREGNLEVMTDTKILPFIDELRSYPANLARNLGLGRQARAALRPLINTLITVPYQWNLNKAYRPTKLTEALFVSALNQGIIGQDVFQAEMARLGYSDDYIKIIQDANTRKLSESEIIKLYFTGAITQADALDKFKALGIPNDIARIVINAATPQVPESAIWRLYLAGKVTLDNVTAALQLRGLGQDEVNFIEQAQKLAAQENEQQAYVDDLISKAKNQFIDSGTLASLLQQTTLTQEEQALIRQRVALYLEYQDRAATLSEMESFYKTGVIDLDDFRNFLRVKGYSTDEQLWFTQYLLLTMDKAKTPKPTKGLSLSELRKAFKAGLIGQQQFHDGAAALGYAEDSIAIFVAELQSPTATT